MAPSNPREQPEDISGQSDLKSTETDEKSGLLPALLSKYSIVWIWSIITGLNSSLFFSFFNSKWNNYGMINMMLIAINLCAITCSLMAWAQLYRVLRRVILPTILEIKVRVEYARQLKSEMSDIAYNAISSSFYFTMLAVTLKSCTFLIEGAFNALSK